jgi:uncharacterized protein (DUF1778 family)
MYNLSYESSSGATPGWCPNFPKGHAKAGSIQVRLNDDDRRRVEKAAKPQKQTVSEWIRSTLSAALEA